MKIKILCYRTPVCYSVWRVVQQAISQLSPQFPDVQFDVVTIKDSNEIIKYTHNLLLPSLVINEKLVSAGYIPTEKEILGWLQVALASSGFQPMRMDN